MWYLSQEPQNPLWIRPDKRHPLPPQRPNQDMSQHMGQIWQMKKPNQIKKNHPKPPRPPTTKETQGMLFYTVHL